MKRTLFAGIFGLLLCSQLTAQVSALGVCVEGNYNISNPYYIPSNKARGFGSGIDIDFKLSKRFYLQASIMYKRFYFSIVEEGRDEMGNLADYEIAVTINTITSPFLLKYRLFRTQKNSVDVSVGPSILYPFGGSIRVKSSSTDHSSSFGREDLETDIGMVIGLVLNQEFLSTKELSPYCYFRYNLTADHDLTGETERGYSFSLGLSIKEVL
jgi:hypothetical protein